MARVVSNVERKLNPNPREHFRRAAAEAECREPHVSCWEDVEASEGEKAKASNSQRVHETRQAVLERSVSPSQGGVVIDGNAPREPERPPRAPSHRERPRRWWSMPAESAEQRHLLVDAAR